MLGKVVKVILIGAIAIGQTVGDARSQEISSIDVRANEGLDQAAQWLVANGIAEYYKENESEEALYSKLKSQWPVAVVSSPIIDTDQFLARFMLTLAGVNYDIMALHRDYHDNTVYEFWLTKITTSSGSDIEDGCRFIVTTADSGVSVRETAHESSTFFSAYRADSGYQLVLPLEDNRLLYNLQPWRFPMCYEDSNLTEYWVIADGSGGYTREKIGMLGKLRLYLQRMRAR